MLLPINRVVCCSNQSCKTRHCQGHYVIRSKPDTRLVTDQADQHYAAIQPISNLWQVREGMPLQALAAMILLDVLLDGHDFYLIYFIRGVSCICMASHDNVIYDPHCTLMDHWLELCGYAPNVAMSFVLHHCAELLRSWQDIASVISHFTDLAGYWPHKCSEPWEYISGRQSCFFRNE